MNIDATLPALSETPRRTAPAPTEWRREPTEAIIRYLMKSHHDWLREALPRIEHGFQLVLDEHGREHGVELRAFQQAYLKIHAELLPHLREEEERIFSEFQAETHAGDLVGGCGKIAEEHRFLGTRLHRLAVMTRQYRIPPYACPAGEALFAELVELDGRLQEHIAIEDDILLPRLLERLQRRS